ncbi:glycoside hydrolase family 25 protein [Flavobacterium lacisediminis]|uniref:Glycoside hydrolase family 25 protein n=1 Tax=Flavobacterium lacisediminis TaxID=2989705 RepID=A0ABT3EGW2_9FLAO|nr:glycoside hydrolase family 25 protein [Flavobacterium lacisediminis]MCW1147821.1 glycoside hydrolase family 25 protein [Flavobacterium lacisediminis]
MASKSYRRKPIAKRKSNSKSKWIFYLISFVLLLFLAIGIYKFRDGFLYYLGFKTDKNVETLSKEERKLADIRIYEVLHKHDDKAIGFDVSEYQSEIDWEQTYHIDESFELSFVFIRATAGKNKTDKRFKENWKASKDRELIRGAYHYYRPNENSIAQAENFIKNVKLEKGDLPPVLDIEKLPKSQSIDSLKVGLRRWLKKVEKHYKVKPIIYSGESYYTDFLKEEFSDYPLWIANYNFWRNHLEDDWLFWQFTEKAQIQGIEGMVDVNVFNGNKNKLLLKCIR